MRRGRVGRLVLLIAVAVATSAGAGTGVGIGGGVPGTFLNFQLVGHHALFGRGMNAAPAIFKQGSRAFLYVGNRTDGSDTCGVGDPRRGTGVPCPRIRPGILILDITDPREPAVVGEIGPPHVGLRGITTRELRVWPDKKLLIVMTFRCSSAIHACPPGDDTIFPFDIKFFDLSDPVHPRLIRSHVTRSKEGQAIKPHEFFLLDRPEEPGSGADLGVDAHRLGESGEAQPCH